MSSIAVLIPTRNRPGSLKETLLHLTQSNGAPQVFVLDSSDGNVASINARTINATKHDTRHIRFPDVNPVKKIAEGLRLASNEGYDYSVLSGDDDKIIPIPLMEACRWLECNPEVSLVMGERQRLAPDCFDASVTRRVSAAVSSKKWPFWALRRTSAAAETFTEIASLDIGSGLQERLLRFYDSTEGGWAQSKTPYLVRNRALHVVDEYGHRTLPGYNEGESRGAVLTRNSERYLLALEERVQIFLRETSGSENHWVSRLLDSEYQWIRLYRRHQNAKGCGGCRCHAVRLAYARLRNIQRAQAAIGLRRALYAI